MFHKRTFLKIKHWIKANPIFAILITIIPIILLFTLVNFNTNLSFQFPFRGLKPIKTTGRDENKIIASISSAIKLLQTRCPTSDEMRPKNFECLNSSGFSSSIIESLAGLYLFGLKTEFETIKEYVFSHFNCDELGWVQRHDFWSRGIGSLISTYIITNDKQFLNLASKCALKAIEISPIEEPFDYINLKEEKGANNQWIDGTLVGDAFVEIPELLALSYLTKNSSFVDEISNIDVIINKLASAKLLPVTFNFSKRQNIYLTERFDGNQINLMNQLAILYRLFEFNELDFVIQDFMKQVKFYQNVPIETYYPLFDVAHLMENLTDVFECPLLANLTIYANEKLNHKIINNLKTTKTESTFFNYETNALRYLAQKAIKKKKLEQISLIKSAIIDPFNSLKSGKGFVGLTSTRKKIVVKGTVMPSNMFGQWLTFAGLLYGHHYDIISEGIFNDRGHLILVPSLHPFSRSF